MEERGIIYRRDGVYYGQDTLAYKEPLVMVHSDDYKTPINKILMKEKPKTILRVKELMDIHGYIGRNKIRRVYKNGCYPTNDYKIQVDLVWSGAKYTWPALGRFSLDFFRIDRDEDLIFPEMIVPALRCLYEHSIGDYRVLTKYMSLNKKESESVISILRQLNLIKNDSLLIVTDNELEEVINNLLTP